MRRLVFGLCLLLPVLVLLPGYRNSGYDPNLEQFSRTPLSVKLSRLLKAGEEKVMQRRFEEAQAIFEAMLELDPRNLEATFWMKKVQERLKREANERFKAEMIRKKGSLQIKESLYDNWVWGPMVGHFTIRESKPKPYVPPVRKVHPRASDDEVGKAEKAAESGKASALFELAMVRHSRAEDNKALDAYEQAVISDPTLLGQDDEGLTAGLLDRAQRALESGKITPEERLRAARVNLLQGDHSDAVIGFIKAASKDATIKPIVQRNLEALVNSGKTDFLLRPPELFSFRQAYLWDNSEDSVYLRIQFRPTSPHFLIPIDLPFEARAIKTIESRSNDILFVINDPAPPEGTRLWLAVKDPGDEVPTVEAKLVLRMHPARVTLLDLSNYGAPADLADNWTVVMGEPTSYPPGFPPGHVEKQDGKIMVRAYRLQTTNGKGPVLDLRDFRKSLGATVNPWKVFEDVLATAP